MNEVPVVLRCPECTFEKEIPAHRIPAGAKTVTCPRCHHSFPLMSEQPSRTELFEERSLGQLFDQSWEIYRKRWLTHLGLLLFTYLLVAVPIGLGLAGGYLAALSWPWIERELLLLGGLVGLAIGMFTMFWGYAGFISAIVDNKLTFRKSLGKGLPLTGAFLWALSLTTFFMTGSMILFFFPGLVLMIWFCFTPFILAEGDWRGMKALHRSRQLVEKDFWPVTLKVLVAMLVPSAIGAVPLVGPLLGLAAAPFSTTMLCLVYQDRHQVKSGQPLVASSRNTLLWTLLAIVGYALVIIPLIYFFSAEIKTFITMPARDSIQAIGLPTLR